jgi:hypothetical protein
VGKALKFGCLGIVGVAIVLGALIAFGASQAKPAQQSVSGTAGTPGTTLAGIGQTATLGGWEVTLLDFGPFERFSPGKAPTPQPQGKLIVADLRIKNLQNSTSNFTQSDFVLKADDGREFKPAGQTATIDRGFVISQTVQPGLTTENRVVFDVDPAVSSLVFTALKMQFGVQNP